MRFQGRLGKWANKRVGWTRGAMDFFVYGMYSYG